MNEGIVTGCMSLLQKKPLVVLFEDAVKQMGKASKSWSPVGLYEHVGVVTTTFEHFVHIAMWVDMAASHLVTEAWHNNLVAWNTCLSILDENSDLPFVPAEVAEDAHAMLDPYIGDCAGSSVLAIVQKIEAQAEFLPRKLESTHLFKEPLATTKARFRTQLCMALACTG